MDTDNLRLLMDVARLGSFAKAARLRDCDPSQVSRTIASLEQQLEFQLFKRSTRSLSLTEAGERYLSDIAPLVEQLEQAKDTARERNHAPAGVLKLTASTAFGQVVLLPVMQRFADAYPAIELELVLSDSNIDLIQSDIDVACRLAPSFDSDLVGFKLLDTHYKVVASPDYIAHNPAIKTPEHLSEHACVVFTLPQFRHQWHFKRGNDGSQSVKIRSRMAVSNGLALRELALQGAGPALAPDWLIKEPIQQGRLVQLLPQWQVAATDFSTGAWLLYPSRKYLPHKTRVLIDFLKSHFQPG